MTRASVEVFNGSCRVGDAFADCTSPQGSITLDAGTEIQMACFSTSEPNTHLLLPLQTSLQFTIIHEKEWNGAVELSIRKTSGEDPWLILTCPHGTNRLLVIPGTKLEVQMIHYSIPEVTPYPDGLFFDPAAH